MKRRDEILKEGTFTHQTQSTSSQSQFKSAWIDLAVGTRAKGDEFYGDSMNP